MRDTDALVTVQECRVRLKNGEGFDALKDVVELTVMNARRVRRSNELRQARKLSELSMAIAEFGKEHVPERYAMAACEVGRSEIDFEEFGPAVTHLQSALKVIELEHSSSADTSTTIRFYLAYAHRKLGHFKTAESIYEKLIAEIKNRPSSSTSPIHTLQLGIVALHIERGDCEIAHAMLSNNIKEWYDPKSPRICHEIWCLIVKLAIANQRAERVAKSAESIVEIAQRLAGKHSLIHADSSELLATVRTKQLRYDEAVELLNDAASTRTRLLGEDHPSVARIRRQLDRIVSERNDFTPQPQSFFTISNSVIDRRDVKHADIFSTPVDLDGIPDAATQHGVSLSNGTAGPLDLSPIFSR